MKGMKGIGVLVGAMLLATVALAASRTISWTKATTNTDGSSIPATGPGSVVTSAELGTCNAGGTDFGTKIADLVVNSAGTTAPSYDFAPGTYCIRYWHTNTYGVESDKAVGKYVEAAPKPNKPSGFTIGSQVLQPL